MMTQGALIRLVGESGPECIQPIEEYPEAHSFRVRNAAQALTDARARGTGAHRMVQHGKENRMKSLDDVKADMSALYEELKAGDVEIKQAAELANITGKYLKAEQLILARQVFEAGSGSAPRQIGS